MNTLPKARTENIVEQNLNKETLIYDLVTNKAFNLNATSSIVYKACDGKTTFDELKRKHKFSDDFIFLALDELKRHELLANDINYISPFANTSRREVIRKVGLATLLMLPIISGLVAPSAAQAASGAGGNNTGGNDAELGVTLFGVCNPYGACYADSQGNRLDCVDSRCCYPSSSAGAGSLLPGERIPFAQTCSDTPGATVSCSSLPEFYGYCCDAGEASGTCTTENNLPHDENGDLPCYFPDGTYQFAYIAHCDCYCS